MRSVQGLKALALVLSIPMVSALATCRAVHQVTEKGVAEAPRKGGTPRFVPPADGRMSAAQIDMFLTVRPHEQAILKAPGGGDQAEARAARETGVEPEEYHWVKERIARALLVRYRIAYQDLGRGRLMRDLLFARTILADPVARGEIDRQVEAIRNGEPIPDSPGLRQNIDLVARNQERLLRGENLDEIQALFSARPSAHSAADTGS